MGKSVLVLSGILALFSSVALAGDLEDEPFAMRLLLSLERASNFSETTGLQAAAANPGGASMNPAADARRTTWGPSATVSSVNAFSTTGAYFPALFGHVSFTPGDQDRLAFAYAHTWPVDGSSRGGFENEFGSDEFYLRYSRPLGEVTTFGAEFRYILARLDEESIPDELRFPARSKTDISGPDLTLGAQTVVEEGLALGFMAGAGIQWTDTTVENMVPLPIAAAPLGFLPPGTELETIDSKVKFLDLRGGVAWDAEPGLRLLADVQYLHYEIEDLSRVGTARFFAGARIGLADGLHLHLGASLDAEAQVNGSAGLAWAPSDTTRLSFSYQYNAYPEVEQEFGRFHQISISFAFGF